jgi:glycosyltransferase involved in cell wall biosynthesis
MEVSPRIKVSVVVPVYNKAPFLAEAFESILSQTFTDFELIAVDDCSTDDSLAILRSFTDPRLRIIALDQNLGPAGAAQRAMDAAIGEYIVRMDADDISVPERVALQVAFMDANPDIGASGGQLRLFGEEQVYWRFPQDPDACAAQLLFGVPVSQGACILRRSLLETHDLRYDADWPRVGEDWLFWLRMARYTRFANLDHVILNYRRGEHNIGHGRDIHADYMFLLRKVLFGLGIPHTETDVELHLLGLRIFAVPPGSASVRALRQWYDRLLLHNTHIGFAPSEAFRHRVAKQWEGIFYWITHYGIRVAFEHLILSNGWPMDRILYAFKYRLNVWAGKIPNN